MNPLAPRLLLTSLLLAATACSLQQRPESRAAKRPDPFQIAMDEGIQRLNARRYENAAIAFNQALALNTNSAKARNYLGVAYFQLKQFDLAEEQFKKALELDPKLAVAANNLGSIYNVTQRPVLAATAFKQAIAIDPELAPAYYNLGALMLAQGMEDIGSGYFSKGVLLDPGYLETNKDFVSSLSQSPNVSPDILFSYAKAYAAAGDADKAAEYLNRAKLAGFKAWQRIQEENAFDAIRKESKIQSFAKLAAQQVKS